jgi:hypothetical protein
MTVAKEPGHRGARSKPLKPLRAGMPGCSGGPVVTNACVYYTPRAAAGASAPGIPHALTGRKFHAELGRIAPRDRGPTPEAVLFAIPAFPLPSKTLYGAARLCHRMLELSLDIKGLAYALSLWRAV